MLIGMQASGEVAGRQMPGSSGGNARETSRFRLQSPINSLSLPGYIVEEASKSEKLMICKDHREPARRQQTRK